MSAVVTKLRQATREANDYLGPATVNGASPGAVVVSLPEGETTRAELAFTVPYAPEVGDVLLVIGRGPRYYAIGVIRGTGKTDLSLQGDVNLRSVGGRLSLSGDRGVDIRGPELGVYTAAVRMIARDLFQSFEHAFQHVSSLLRVHAGETHTLVDRSSITQSKSATILAQDSVTLNGHEIHIG